MLTLDESDYHKQDKQYQEQAPAIIAREGRQEGACGHPDQVLRMIVLYPCEEIVTGHQDRSGTYYFTERCALQIEHTWIHNESQGTYKARAIILCQAACRTKQVDYRDKVTQHR